ncbi:MAG: indolepyruvate ferredoxin oxidoreductase, partial [Phycisphaerales bacterium]|nr:indolepyruvate ferredoxin oxidoreductase [Phycisphaerales bacterium]
MGVDPRFHTSAGREVFTGNEILIKGALEVEGGVHLYTGYPGSPVAGFFDVLGDIQDVLKKHGVRAFQANNEALGAAALNGSQMLPARGLIAMKSVGVHVAADALALGNLAGAHPDGGAVVIAGDDPWCDSTQVPADSRFLFEHLRMPVVEPGTIQETKDWIDLCFKLSQAAQMFIGYVVTTAQADGGGSVECRPNAFPDINIKHRVALETANVDLGKVLLPPRTWQRELLFPERFAKTIVRARELGLNKILPAFNSALSTQHSAPLGFIVTGMAGPYLQHVLTDLGLSGQFPILRMGMSYPVDVELVAEFAKTCQKMVVIEERRSFLEKNIRDAAFRQLPPDEAAALAGRLYGKQFPSAPGVRAEGVPEVRGLNVSNLAKILIPLIKSAEEIPEHLRNGRLTAEMDRLRKLSKPKLNVLAGQVAPVARTPTFCPGCPHRDSSATLLQLRLDLADPAYMKKAHGRDAVDLVAHGDTGCYTMLMFAPTEQLMHNYSGMGLGAGTGSGIDPFITNKQLVFMGDGTFFHSGQVAISNAVKAGQDITFIILENGTTAMTGHQEHPGTDVDLLGNESFIQDIESVVRAMKGTSPLTVIKLSPADRDLYRKTLEKTILADGVKVVIADKECGITAQRSVLRAEKKKVKETGFLPTKTHMNVTPEVCEHCLECTKQTACPGLTIVDTDYGRKVDTDLTWCVNDGACERVQVSNGYAQGVKPCPSFEQLTVHRTKRRRYRLPDMQLSKLPDPTPFHTLAEPGDAWRAHLSGVGGMGIGVVNAILVRAGHKQGYRVLFQDKKGMAIRNGGVYSQISFIRDADERGQTAEGRGQEGEKSAGPSSLSTQHSALSTSPTPPASEFTTGSIPFGKADLLLGIDVLEAARAIDPREQFRVASADRTSAVLNLHKQPTVFTLLGKEDFDPNQLRDGIAEHCLAGQVYAKNLSEVCEQRLGSKLYVNILMLGVAYQLGLIPVSAHSIAWSIRDTIRRDHRKNLKAFNIGRRLALEPRALPNRPEPVTWEQVVTNKNRVLRKTKGETGHTAFEQLARAAVASMPGLPEQTKYDLAVRVYDLFQYENLDFARLYVDRVRKVYARDSAARGYAATAAVVWNLAKVTLIKDEVYVSYLLTRYEKKVRDAAKFHVDEANGDRITYKHHTSPEFNVGPWRFRMKITTRDWQLKLVRHMKWWRKIPGWHKRETAFRDWYVGLLDRVSLGTPAEYDRAVRVLNGVGDVNGYREIRYPKMDAAMAVIEAELAAPLPVAAAPAAAAPIVPELTVNRDVL